MLNARAILFDLDGTLVESLADIAASANRALEALGMAALPQKQLEQYVGNGAAKLIKRALTGDIDGEPDPALFEQALQLFFDFYQQHIFVETTIYPGVIETLGRFQHQGFTMACVTNKPGRHTLSLLKQAGLAPFFPVVVAGDTLTTRKPDPDQLLFAAEQMGVQPHDCIMVGDSINDIRAAQAAAMPVLCLTYGYNQGVDLSTTGADALVGTFPELAELVTIHIN